MNTILFLCGAGTGALVATSFMIFLMNRLSREKTNQTNDVLHFNKLSLQALERRNDIGEQQLKALQQQAHSLETLAEWANHNYELISK